MLMPIWLYRLPCNKNGAGIWEPGTGNLGNLAIDGTFPPFCQALFRFPAPQPAENMSKFLPPNLPIISPFRRILTPAIWRFVLCSPNGLQYAYGHQCRCPLQNQR
jgi:hypothetical protein